MGWFVIFEPRINNTEEPGQRTSKPRQEGLTRVYGLSKSGLATVAGEVIWRTHTGVKMPILNGPSNTQSAKTEDPIP
jgi:hypothetical protein